MKISRIKRIQNYRIYQNWSMQNGDADFTRFNIIYGGNGSGKSTLASLLIELAGGDWSSGTTLVVKDGDGQNHREIKNLDEALATRLCIFNADYIKQNIRFDSSETESLLYLGKESIDNQNQREALEDAIKNSEQEIPQMEKELKKQQKKRDKIATDGASRVVSKLQGVDQQYGGRRFRRPQFETALGIPYRDMSDFDVDQQIKRVASPATERIDNLPVLSIPLPEAATQVNEVLAQTVTSQAIEALKNNHEAANWVQAGRHATPPCRRPVSLLRRYLHRGTC